MYKRLLPVLWVVMMVGWQAAGAAEMRTWTSDGGKTIEAELHSVQGSVVVLKDASGALLRIPRSNLSEDDQRYLRNPASRLSHAPKGPVLNDVPPPVEVNSARPEPRARTRPGPAASDFGSPEADKPMSPPPAASERANRRRPVTEPPEQPFAPATPATREMAPPGPAAAPTVKKAGATLVIGALAFERGESAHFIGLSQGGPPDALLKNAEAVWLESARTFSDFKDLWVDDAGNPVKMALFQVASKEAYGHFCKAMVERLRADNKHDAADRIEALIDHSAAALLNLDAYLMMTVGTALQDSLIITYTARAGRADRLVMDPFRTHIVAQRLLAYETERLMQPDFWLNAGFGYNLEISLCGRTDTHLVDYENYRPQIVEPSEYNNGTQGAGNAPGGGGGGVIQGRHFADGGRWVSLIKELQASQDKSVAKGTIADLFGLSMQNLSPEQCGYSFAFVRFLMRDANSSAIFGKLIESAKNGPRSIRPEDLVAAYGYADVEAMQKAWQAFMRSPAFK